ncbi:MAG TPA: DinB family protein [Terracidiphilus sp.]|jgi:hypothetical protein|nr:DinB family protein [Terracidiphilus sp.]
MRGRPDKSEAAEYYFTYIDQVAGDDPVAVMREQLSWPEELAAISEERSLYRYAPDKWSMRQAVNHVTDTERAFVFRALWFGRGFDAPLPSFDQTIAAAGAEADGVSWAAHLEEFRQVRSATLWLFANMPEAGWTRGGVASGNYVSVRALAFGIAGHAAHHGRVLREKYGI